MKLSRFQIVFWLVSGLKSFLLVFPFIFPHQTLLFKALGISLFELRSDSLYSKENIEKHAELFLFAYWQAGNEATWMILSKTFILLSFVCLGITTVLTMTFLGLEARKDLPKVCSVCDFLCLDNLHWLHARWPIPLLWTTLSSSPLPISFQPSSRFS